MVDFGGKTSPSRRRKWLRRLAWVVFIYAVVGFLILPLIIRIVAVKQLAKQLNREVSIEKVRLNPFALSVAVRGLLIKDKDGQPFVSWEDVYVNFQLSSFFGKEWAFKEIRTTKPFFRIQVNKDGTMNFSDLFAKSTSTETNAPAAPAKPFALWIGEIKIDGARVAITDLTPRTPFERTLGPMTVSLNEFRTDPESKNPYTFEATTDAGGKLAWSGYFRLDPVRSQGRFLIENIALGKYAALYEDLVQFRVREGAVDIGAEYHIELNPTNRIASVTNALFALRSLKLGVADSDVNIAELEEFSIKGASVDVTKQWAEINSISSHGGKFILKRDTNAALNVVVAAKPTEGAAANAPRGVTMLLQSVTNAVAALINQTNQWTGIVREVNIHDDTVIWEDHVNSRPARMQADQIAITAKNISNYPGTNVTSSLSFRWNTNGTIKVDADAIFTPLTVNFQFAFEHLELRPLDPYLEPILDLYLVDGKFGSKGTVHLGVKEGELPELKISAEAWLNDFATVDGRFAEDLMKWRSLRVSGVDVNLDPLDISIKEVALDDAFAKIVIETNKISNLAVVLRSAEANAEPEKPVVAEKKPEVAPTAPVSAPKDSDSTPPKFSLTNIVLSNAQVRFVDRSVSPAVNTSMQQLGGTISGISSDENKAATINLHGKVDNTGPIELSGIINPIGKNFMTDLKFVVKNVDLTPASPYSGKYAGYTINKGKLGFDLDYKIANRKLAAKNVVVIDQFTFGQKVNSPDATKLPVKLGVAVMKDRKGVIELDVPVEGSLDDPQFHLGGVVARAVLNVITKVLTSPFSVLSAAFGGGGEELSYQEFAPGGAVLSVDGAKKLEPLMKALQERPALELEIEGSVDMEADRAGIRRMKLAREIRTKKWMSLRQLERSTLTPDQVTLSLEEGELWLKTLYNTALEEGRISLTVPTTNQTVTTVGTPVLAKPETGKGASALLPAKQAAAGDLSAVRSTDPALPAELKPRRANDANEMAQALMVAIPVSDDDFKELATGRAKAVREHILQNGVAVSDRVFLTETQSGGVKTQGSRAYLHLR